MILATERLVLREFKLADRDALLKVLGDPVAMQHYPAPFNREGVQTWIARNVSRYATQGFGLWARILKPGREVIGDCGCVLQEIEERQEIEVAYHVRRDLWGRGYATEAARACMNFAFARLGVARVVSMIRPENLQSRRVAEKNGLFCEGMVFWHGYDHCVYVKNRAEA